MTMTTKGCQVLTWDLTQTDLSIMYVVLCSTAVDMWVNEVGGIKYQARHLGGQADLSANPFTT